MESKPAPRTGLVLAGSAVALVAGAAVAWGIVARHRGEPAAPPPASKAGLVIDETSAPAPKLNPTKPLRCFVAGRYIGDFAIVECARRNGVATDQLDVGVDRTGALAAAQSAGAMITPLPPQEAEARPLARAAEAPSAPAGPCWRYAEGTWRRLSDMPLAACVQTLFAGRCEKPGGALYGRWTQQTLRLVPGRVEISGDNRDFRPIAEQAPGCAIGAIG